MMPVFLLGERLEGRGVPSPLPYVVRLVSGPLEGIRSLSVSTFKPARRRVSRLRLSAVRFR